MFLILLLSVLSGVVLSAQVSLACFGASLTEGYSQQGKLFHPYSLRLGQRFPEYHVVNAGKSGERACDMMTRLDSVLSVEKFDWLLVLAGTNDVTGGNSSEQIYGCLNTLWTLTRKRGVKVLAMTIPEVEGPWYTQDMERARQGANALLRQASSSNSTFDLFFDLDINFPQHSLNEPMKRKYWDDGIHATLDGYDLIGDLLADFLSRKLETYLL